VPAAGSPSGHAHGQGDRARATSEPATPPAEVLPFGDGMTRPRLLAGRQPAYTTQALAARVEGKLIIRCVITERGDARDCRIVKPLPLLDRAAVQALVESRFAPATFRGQSVAVNYLFTFDFELP
jgi:protein TonB